MTIHDILDQYRHSATEQHKGALFERLMARWLMTDPRYATLFQQIWLWADFPSRADLGTHDLGIDLVGQDNNGDFWAIQCKCYAADTVISKDSVDSFIANSGREFTHPTTQQTTHFLHRMWISTSEKWGHNAQESFKGQSIETLRIHLHDLEISSVDWQKITEGHSGTTALQDGKSPRPDQLRVISHALSYYAEGHSRGKIIMACGTGKTFTSLRIAEEMLADTAHPLVLFLVPSIALLGQSLNAWLTDRRRPMVAICVCSDSSASQLNKADDEDHIADDLSDLPYPATTNVGSIVSQLRRAHLRTDNPQVVVFSTYQSIAVIHAAQRQLLTEDPTWGNFDLVVCDEAHRTASVDAPRRKTTSANQTLLTADQQEEDTLAGRGHKISPDERQAPK